MKKKEKALRIFFPLAKAMLKCFNDTGNLTKYN